MSRDTGLIYDEKTKLWGYRIKMKDGLGKYVDTTRKGFDNKTQARQARQAKVQELREKKEEVKDYSIYTFEYVFNHYLENRAKEKRVSTIKKQMSLWTNHIQALYGDKKLMDVNKGDLYDYLVRLYREGDFYNNYERGYTYGYVEGYLKIFFLVYGYAHDNDWVTSEQYNKMFVNKGTKLTMPKQKEEDEDAKIVIYAEEEIEQIKKVICSKDVYITFLFGYHLGLRIGEAMALRWQDIDWKRRTIEINKQMQYESKCFILIPPKTKNSKRVLQIPEKLYDFLKEYKKEQERNKRELGIAYKDREVVREMLRGNEKELVGSDFIQRRGDGTLMTNSVMKYWTKIIKERTGIHFKFHNLRHTNASMLAALNIPILTLQEHLGHSKPDTMNAYYVTATETSQEKLRNALNTL